MLESGLAVLEPVWARVMETELDTELDTEFVSRLECAWESVYRAMLVLESAPVWGAESVEVTGFELESKLVSASCIVLACWVGM